METELKLLVHPNDAHMLRHHPLLAQYAVEPPREQTLSGIYFDTKEYDLRRADAGLRVRQVNQDWVQTLKAGGTAVAGLHVRHEWESIVTGPIPDLDALRRQIDPKSSYAKLIKHLGKRSQLIPTFTTSITRTVWNLRLPEGDEVECVIDRGSIDTDDSKTPVSELELELKSGDPTHLFDLALRLQDDVPMQIGNFSKADRGYGLVRRQATDAVQAAPIRLSPRMTIESAFKTIVLSCLDQVQSNEPGVTIHHDVEHLHQMRVGLRRLRSALVLFKSVIACPESITVELSWLGTILSQARDWDVLHGSTLPAIRHSVSDPDLLESLHEAVRARATACHETAAATLGSSRYTKLILRFYRWVQAAEWRGGRSADQRRQLERPVVRFARTILLHDQRRLLRRGQQLQHADAGARHGVRIAAKKARYGIEFFESLYSKKQVRPYLQSLSLLQDQLGALNDAAVGRTLLRALEASHPQLRVEAAFIWGYMTCRLDQDLPHLNTAWKRFKATSLPKAQHHQ